MIQFSLNCSSISAFVLQLECMEYVWYLFVPRLNNRYFESIVHPQKRVFCFRILFEMARILTKLKYFLFFMLQRWWKRIILLRNLSQCSNFSHFEWFVQKFEWIRSLFLILEQDYDARNLISEVFALFLVGILHFRGWDLKWTSFSDLVF